MYLEGKSTFLVTLKKWHGIENIKNNNHKKTAKIDAIEDNQIMKIPTSSNINNDVISGNNDSLFKILP